MPPQYESDFYPYGGEYPITLGDSNHYKFTGKERDLESGLDNFGARYNTSSLGRFMTPDFSDEDDPVPYAHLSDPQALNLYSYVGNNPTSLADDDGHDPCGHGDCDLADEMRNSIALSALGYAFRRRGGEDTAANCSATEAASLDAIELILKVGGTSGFVLLSSQPAGGGKELQFEKEAREHKHPEPAAAAGSAGSRIPGHPFTGPNAARDAFKHLAKYHGIDPTVASERLHQIKQSAGLGAADNVVIGRTGDVYNPYTGERIGSLTEGH
jgi:RHS repeat-associated protein